jgi:hypothetical protein
MISESQSAGLPESAGELLELIREALEKVFSAAFQSLAV